MPRPLNILHLVGARPNFMKTAPLMRAMSKHPDELQQVLVHSGQHYDENMSDVFFQHLEMPKPDVHLGVTSGSHAQQTAQVLERLEPVLQRYEPDWVVVVGDVNSTLAGALTAAKLGINVAHVEAGLRSYDWTMPEEINRVLTDQLSAALFTPTRDANENLVREGILADRIHLVGDVMIDTLIRQLPKAEQRWPALRQAIDLSEKSPFVLVTLHRPANVDDELALRELVLALEEVSALAPVVFPVHPRTRRQLTSAGMYENLDSVKNLKILEPLGYLDFLALEGRAAVVITDSGGIQEETTFLGIPCLTVRPNTERPVTLTLGTNKLVDRDVSSIVSAAKKAINAGAPVKHDIPELWDGHAAERIVEVLIGLIESVSVSGGTGLRAGT